MLTKNDYKWAYLADTAVNLSALACSLVEVCSRIRAEAKEQGIHMSTQELNRHPIVKLYVEAMFFLAGGHEGCEEARRIACEKAEIAPFVFQD